MCEELRIADIDTQKAIDAIGGNKEAYLNLLGDYRRDIPSKIDDIRLKQQLPDLSEFVILVHGQKGASRMSGITELGEEFYGQELAGKANDRTYISENLEKVLAHYYSYYQILEPYDVRINRVSASGLPIEEVLGKLTEALEDFETDDAEEFVAELESLCFSEKQKEIYGRLKDAMDNMDYFASTECANELLEVIISGK